MQIYMHLEFSPKISDHRCRPFTQKEDSINYVDGCAIAVPIANRDTYIKHAEVATEVFKENGALSVVERRNDDVLEGTLTSFPLAVMRKYDEWVMFSWTTWPSMANA